MPTKAELDSAFLARHDALTTAFYRMKAAGQITPRHQALFDKAHGRLSLVHERAIRLAGIDPDYYVDEVLGDNGSVVRPGAKLRSQEIAEALAGAFGLTLAEVAEVMTQWRVSL